jgi:hypothetical protein
MLRELWCKNEKGKKSNNRKISLKICRKQGVNDEVMAALKDSTESLSTAV